ncbi:M48 family metallopeptidase [Rheinheimera gaetbuli]
MSALVIDSPSFSYQLYYSKKRRSVALQIKQGELIVRAPLGYCLSDIQKLVEKKKSWISKHLQQAQQQVKPDWLMQRQVPVLGIMMPLHLQFGLKSQVQHVEYCLTVTVSTRTAAQNFQRRALVLIQQWYQEQAACWFTERVAYWQNRMQLRAGELVIGNWQTKWGYCKSTAQLGFNWRLLMAPAWVADYVVVHELAHLKHLNHSSRFWRLVTLHYPQAELAKVWLRQNQHQLAL